MSTATTGSTTSVSQVAGDDQGNAAFGFNSGYDPTTGATIYSVYLWQNGSVSLAQSAPLQVPDGGAVFNVGAIDTSGNAYEVGQGAGDAFPVFVLQGGSYTHLYAPDPPYADAADDDAPASIYVDGVANHGIFFGQAYGVYSDGTTVDTSLFEIVNNGEYANFDGLLAGEDPDADIPSNMQAVNAAFSPALLSDSGTAIGWSSVYDGPTYWDGQNLVQLPGSPAALNDAGSVVGTDGTNAYYWTEAAGEQSLNNRMPLQYQGEVWNLTPTMISAPDANGAVTVSGTAAWKTAPSGATTSGTITMSFITTGTTPATFKEASLPSVFNPVRITSNGGFVGTQQNLATGHAAAVNLPPVNITVWPENAPYASSDVVGVVVPKGSIVTISLSGTSSNVNLPLPSGQPVWKSRQLNSDGTYTAWTPMGPTCTGTQFNYTTSNGGIFQLEAVFFGDDADAVQFVRKHDDPYSCHEPGGTPTLVSGSLDAFGVTTTNLQITILAFAREWLGSTAYAANGPSPDFDPAGFWTNKDKCNLFVADVCDDADAPVPDINSFLNFLYIYPPTADQWAGLDPKPIPNWTLLPLAAAPEPGRVVARGEPNGYSGHSGILDYDGQWISAGDLWVNRLANLATYYTQLNFLGSHQPAGQRIYANGN